MQDHLKVFEKNRKKYARNVDTGKATSLAAVDINLDDDRESSSEELAGEETAALNEGRLLSQNILHLNSLYDFVRDHRKTGDDGLRLAQRMEKSTVAYARSLRNMLMRSLVFTSGVATITSATGVAFTWDERQAGRPHFLSQNANARLGS